MIVRLLLTSSLRAALAGVAVAPSERYGVPAQDREALAFAILGYQTLHGPRPTCPPAQVPARRPCWG